MRTRWPIALAAPVLVVAVLSTAIALRRGAEPTYAAPQLARMADACHQWAERTGDDLGRTDACVAMVTWMDRHADQVPHDRMMSSGAPMGPMMWQSPSNAEATCRAWAADDRSALPSSTDPTAWCTSMVEWMAQHPGGWSGWMHDTTVSSTR
jgi:hypothetical protein